MWLILDRECTKKRSPTPYIKFNMNLVATHSGSNDLNKTSCNHRQSNPLKRTPSNRAPIPPSRLLPPRSLPPNLRIQTKNLSLHLNPVPQPRLPRLLGRCIPGLRKPDEIPFRMDMLPAKVLLLLQMTRDANGVVSQEDFVYKVFVPGGAGRAATWVV